MGCFGLGGAHNASPATILARWYGSCSCHPGRVSQHSIIFRTPNEALEREVPRPPESAWRWGLQHLGRRLSGLLGVNCAYLNHRMASTPERAFERVRHLTGERITYKRHAFTTQQPCEVD